MSRTVIVLTLSAGLGAALPAAAGPNGSSVPPYFPLQPQLNPAPAERPHALLGDSDRYTGDRTRSDVRRPQPPMGWQRRPSEAK